MKERYIATVDMGSSKLALSVARVIGGDVQVLYYKEHPSDGVRYSRIFSPIRASVALKKAIKEAEEELGIRIRQVVIGLPRYGVRSETATASTQRSEPNTCITQEEINGIKEMALDNYPLDDETREEMYGAVAQSFSTEDAINFSENDVIGMPSASIDGIYKVFVGSKKSLNNIDIMLSNAGVAEAAKYFLPLSTADAVLSSEEKENGVALIEIGAGVSSITIYQDNILRYYYSIPFGGRNITTDIKYECGFTERLAENIKLAYGACMPERLQNMSDKILQINDNEEGIPRNLSVKYLSEIITARVKEIVDALLFKIQESGYADKLRNGIVLTGGCANMLNISYFVKQMSGYNVRIGYPRVNKFCSSGCAGMNETSAAGTVGMLLLASSDSHIDCASEKPHRKEALKQDKTEENEAKTGEIFSREEIETVEIPKKPKKEGKKSNNNNVLTWTKKIVNEFFGEIYEGMDEKQ